MFENRQTVTIEAAGHTGSVTIPKVMEPDQLDHWWQATLAEQERPKEDRVQEPECYRYLRPRLALVLALDFPGHDLTAIQAGESRPWPAVAWQIVEATNNIVEEATIPPKLRGKSTKE